jgi:hypothetical protein
MKDELYKQLIALVMGGVLGVVFKYWYDYKATVLKSLWDKRYETYKNLLSITALLPLYPARAEVSYGEVFHAAEKMRDWYFSEGGLLLSKKARDKYFTVHKKIGPIVKNRRKHDQMDPLGPDYELIRNCFSELRTELTNDLMSRMRLHGLFEGKNKEPDSGNENS